MPDARGVQPGVQLSCVTEKKCGRDRHEANRRERDPAPKGGPDMILTQHYLACLSHASYLIGDETTGRAVVVDPRRDIGVYLQEAAERGLRIERVIETHVHADFLSGHLELADRTGAVISYGEGADVGFPVEPLR